MAKTALVTGGSEGIGLAIARRLKDDGFQVTLVARNEDKLREATRSLGDNHHYRVADLTNEDGQRAIAQHLREQSYDLLVNNAGVGVMGEIATADIARQIAMIRLNVEALVQLSHAYLAGAKSGDALINVSSALAFLPMPGMGTYSATKSFVTAFTDVLWYEQKKRGVYVMALHPGATTTNFSQNAGNAGPGNFPAHLSQTPEQVAETMLRHLHQRRTPTVISGEKNILSAALSRLLPRKLVVELMGRMTANR